MEEVPRTGYVSKGKESSLQEGRSPCISTCSPSQKNTAKKYIPPQIWGISPKVWVEPEDTVMNFHSNIIHNKLKCKQHKFHK